MRFKRAGSVVVQFHDQQLIFSNFLTQKSCTINSLGIDILAKSDDWRDIEFYLEEFPGISQETIAALLLRLTEFDALIVEASPLSSQNEKYLQNWKWGAMAGWYHFGIKYCRFSTDEEAHEWYISKADQTGPELYKKNHEYSTIMKLDPDHTFELNNFSAVLQKRRSNRNFTSAPILKEQLAACLYYGIGITALMEVPGLGDLPIKMTPSGGARNPYEAYVYVLNVKQIPPGIYHYSAYEHSLGLVKEAPLPLPRFFLGEQEWADNAAAIIFLVANYERTMWKYLHPNAYRVVLFEGGHIIQNMALAATAKGMISASTAAISEEVAEAALNIEDLTQSVNYALAIGMKEPPKSDL